MNLDSPCSRLLLAVYDNEGTLTSIEHLGLLSMQLLFKWYVGILALDKCQDEKIDYPVHQPKVASDSHFSVFHFFTLFSCITLSYGDFPPLGPH